MPYIPDPGIGNGGGVWKGGVVEGDLPGDSPSRERQVLARSFKRNMQQMTWI